MMCEWRDNLSCKGSVRLNVLFTHCLLNQEWMHWTAEMKILQLMMVPCPSLPQSNNAIRRGRLWLWAVGRFFSSPLRNQRQFFCVAELYQTMSSSRPGGRQRLCAEICPGRCWQRPLPEGSASSILSVWPDKLGPWADRELHDRYSLMSMRRHYRPVPSLLGPMHGYLHRQRQNFGPCAPYWLFSFLLSILVLPRWLQVLWH